MAENQALVRARRVIERLVVSIEAAFNNFESASAQANEAETALVKANREYEATFDILCRFASCKVEAAEGE